MKVDNFTQFANLLATKKMLHLHPVFGRLYTCITTLNALCVCDDVSLKNVKSQECNRMYREALSTIDKFKPFIFNGITDNTVSFFSNGHIHLKTIGR